MSISSDRTTWLPILLLVFVGSVIYSNTLNVPFYFDDINNIQNPALRIEAFSIEEFSKVFSSATLHGRPVSNLSFALNYYIGGNRVQGYHLVNISIHILSAIFLYLLLMRTLSLPVNSRKYINVQGIALVTALLWLAHPLATQSVTYTVQRMNSMAAMFYVLSLLCYVIGRERQIERKIGSRRMIAWGWLVGSIFSGFLALGSKEIAATLPVFIFLYEWYFFQDLSWVWLKRKIYWLVGVISIGVSLGFYYLGKTPWQLLLSDCPNRDFTALERLLTQFRVVIYYVGLLIYPAPDRLGLDHEFSLSTSFISPVTTLFSFAAIGCVVLLAILFARRERLLSFCIVWFLGNLIIESSVICLEIIFEHRTYLPAMFFLLFVVACVVRLVQNRAMVYLIFVLIIALSAYWTVDRNRMWQDTIAFWQNEVAMSPIKARPHIQLAKVLLDEGRNLEAEAELRNAIELDPDSAVAYNNLGAALVGSYQEEEAEYSYRKSIEIQNDYVGALNNLASLLVRNDRHAEAKKYYTDALEVSPYNITCNFSLGRLLLRENAVQDALDHFEIVLKQEENSLDVLQEKAAALMKLGRNDEAMVIYRHLLDMGVEISSVHYNLGKLLIGERKEEEALVHYKRALYLTSPRPPVAYNIGNVLFRLGKLGEAEKYYNKFLGNSPIVGRALNNMGLIAAQQGAYKEAFNQFQKAVSLNPEDQLARQNMELALEYIQSAKENDSAKDKSK